MPRHVQGVSPPVRKIRTDKNRVVCNRKALHIGNITSPGGTIEQVEFHIGGVKSGDMKAVRFEKGTDAPESVRTGKVTNDGDQAILRFEFLQPLKQFF